MAQLSEEEKKVFEEGRRLQGLIGEQLEIFYKNAKAKGIPWDYCIQVSFIIMGKTLITAEGEHKFNFIVEKIREESR